MGHVQVVRLIVMAALVVEYSGLEMFNVFLKVGVVGKTIYSKREVKHECS